MRQRNVTLRSTQIPFDKFQYQCAFCQKSVHSPPESIEICKKLSGENRFFCPFCIRHSFDNKNQDVLILSFRAIVGYFYYAFYAYKDCRSVWLSEIQDMIAAHARVGLNNPLFSYDPESLLWFIDFSRDLELSDVLTTVKSILTCFGLERHVPGIHDTYEKYKIPIEEFNKIRKYQFLIPTLDMTKVPRGESVDKTKSFIPKMMKLY